MKIKEVAQLCGISVRTLHYYDEINLLSPHKLENGYRYYSEADLDRLQQILFFRELDLSLELIKKLIANQDNQLDILKKQRQLFLKKQQQLSAVMKTLDDTIKSIEGGNTMTIEEKFEGFTLEDHQPYQEEAERLYGKNDTPDINQLNMIFKELATLKKAGYVITTSEVQQSISALFKMLNQTFNCSLEVFSQIGEMYVYDERFKNNIDKFDKGLADYIMQAIHQFSNKI